MSNPKIKRALVSVTDKTGVVDFVRVLVEEFGVEIISTGGSARTLGEAGLPVTPIHEVTHFPEMMDGRVKTLHPCVHAALLARRDIPDHMREAEKQGIELIDMIVVNLYAFEKSVSCGADFATGIEHIDIGGPAMLRSASKNFESVTVLSHPSQYRKLLAEMRATGGSTLESTRLRLAREAFSTTAAYDQAITTWLSSQIIPQAADSADTTDAPTIAHPLCDKQLGGADKGGHFDQRSIALSVASSLRYGENPHQPAAFYRLENCEGAAYSLAHATQHQGKELSYNNYLDLDAAWSAVREFDRPACVVVKHLTPCGVCESDTVVDAYKAAYAADPVSAYGGVLAFNRAVTSDVVVAIFENKQFVEAIVAPAFSGDALAMYAVKKNARLLSTGGINPCSTSYEYRSVEGGLLYQQRDAVSEDPQIFVIPSKRKPTDKEMADLLFAWKVGKSVKSNAIVIAKDHVTVGVGGGQPNRVCAARIAVECAGKQAMGAVAASDAFFPFRDGFDVLARAGVQAVIEPGGSIRDEEVIAAANEQGLALVFTGHRHFRH